MDADIQPLPTLTAFEDQKEEPNKEKKHSKQRRMEMIKPEKRNTGT